ncbi:MAG TPA: CDP-archaeol synthase [Ktedonobacteraceae bacterium]|nr:CDP-archaeol synthase [Ktedonobacteraceae bacterium]
MADPQHAAKPGQSVGLRWLTAVIAIPIVLALVWFGGWIAFVGALLALVGVIVEMQQMMVHAGYRPLLWISLGLGILFLLAAVLPEHRLLLLECALGLAVLVPLPCFFLRQKLDGALVDWALTLAITLYLGWSISCFLLLRGSESGTVQFTPTFALRVPAGIWWLLTMFLGVWGFDTAAFFSGRYFGRHKLAPHISPGKTWEGVCGGFVFSIIAALVLTVIPLGVPWYLAVLLGLLIGATAVLGDLAESLIKRQTHVKDSGQMMPGHGGLLDRMDSLLFAVIVVYLFAQLLGK